MRNSLLGDVDFITTMGAGYHAHPGGTKKGAKELVQACEAYKRNISIQNYAKEHEEFSQAIEFFAPKN